MFLHGTRLTRAQWLPQLRRLSDRYRCIAVDLPGHGARRGEPFTMAGASDAVVAAIEAEAPAGRAVIVGLSLGGYVAIETAERCPERVAGLVLAGCSAEPVGPVAAVVPRRSPGGSSTRQRGGLGVVNRGFFRLRYGTPDRATRSSPAASGRSAAPQALRELVRTPLRRAPGAASGRRSSSSTAPSIRCSGPAATRGPPPAGAAATSSSRGRCTSPTSTGPGRSPTSSRRSSADPTGGA